MLTDEDPSVAGVEGGRGGVMGMISDAVGPCQLLCGPCPFIWAREKAISFEQRKDKICSLRSLWFLC